MKCWPSTQPPLTTNLVGYQGDRCQIQGSLLWNLSFRSSLCQERMAIYQPRLLGSFKIGDKVGVGCLVGSCRSYQSCASDYE
ncbi:putative cinnamyl-alcohol dehydrogenase [Helianthus anomalus]